MDETALFYKLLSRGTYVSRSESKKVVSGTKIMKVKDRVSANVCTNADETTKLPIAIIGKPQGPFCFRLGSPFVHYMSQCLVRKCYV